jgi:hypothetical protein
MDTVAARATELAAGHEAALRRAADLQDEVRAAVFPGDAGVVAQGDVVAEPEPAAAGRAVVRPLLAEAAADAEVDAVVGNRGRHVERAGRRRTAAGEDDGLGDAASRVDRGARVDADVGGAGLDGGVGRLVDTLVALVDIGGEIDGDVLPAEVHARVAWSVCRAILAGSAAAAGMKRRCQRAGGGEAGE